MPFETQQEGSYTIVLVDELRLDASIAESFKTYLFDQIEAGNTQLIVDLSRIRFMDSSGLGSLVAGLKKTAESGSFDLAGAQPAVKDLFDLTSMDKLFNLHDSVEDAVRGQE